MTQGIPSRLNLVIAGAQLTALALILAGAKHAAGFALFAWAIAFAFVMQSAHALLHEASHRKLHPNRRVNDGVGFLLAAIFPTSFTFITAAHLSHHRVNRSDAELFDYIKAHEKPWQKIAGYYALIIGLLWAGQVFFSFGLSVTSRATTKRAYAALDKDGRRFFSFLLRLPRARIRVEVLGIVALWTLAIVLLDLDLRTIAACYGDFIFSCASQQQIYHTRTPSHVVDGA